MRNGTILAEAPPQELLLQYKCDALEDVFLLLSEKQASVEMNQPYPSKRKAGSPPLDAGSLWDTNRVMAEIYKNSCLFRRNISMLLFMIALPAFVVFTFCIMCSGSLKGVVISSVSDELWPYTCLQQDHPVDVKLQPCTAQSQLSCRFLQYLQEDDYIVEEHLDYHSAYRSMFEGQANAMIYFERNYSLALISRLSELSFTPEKYINSSILKVFMDRSDPITSNRIEHDFRESLRKLTNSVSKDCEYNPWHTEVGPRIKTLFGEITTKYTESSIPGFLIPFLFYVSACMSSTAVSSEKSSGFLDRSLISGVRQTELIFAQTLVQILTVTGQNILMLILVYGIFNIPQRGSWWLTITIIFLAELQGMVFGYILSGIIKYEKDITFASIGTVLFLFTVSGMSWPKEGIHWIIKNLIVYSPLMMGVESYRGVTLRGWGIRDHLMTISFLMNIGMILLFICVYVIICKVKK